jgi:hypothetical protein
MLMVAPRGKTNSVDRFDTPALTSAHSIVTGNVADDEVSATDSLLENLTDQTVSELVTIQNKLDLIVDAVKESAINEDQIINTVQYSFKNGVLRDELQETA